MRVGARPRSTEGEAAASWVRPMRVGARPRSVAGLTSIIVGAWPNAPAVGGIVAASATRAASCSEPPLVGAMVGAIARALRSASSLTELTRRQYREHDVLGSSGTPNHGLAASNDPASALALRADHGRGRTTSRWSSPRRGAWPSPSSTPSMTDELELLIGDIVRHGASLGDPRARRCTT
jgi:hypothetical protein